MQKLHKKYKMYAWESNKGYGTPEHRTAIGKHGLCKYHRKSFNIFSARLSEVCDENFSDEINTTLPTPQVPALLFATHQKYNL
jgi:ribonuclease HII